MINVCEVLHVVITGEEVHVEYPPFDGWFNNLAHPDWGGAGQQLSPMRLYTVYSIYELFKCTTESANKILINTLRLYVFVQTQSARVTFVHSACRLKGRVFF